MSSSQNFGVYFDIERWRKPWIYAAPMRHWRGEWRSPCLLLPKKGSASQTPG